MRPTQTALSLAQDVTLVKLGPQNAAETIRHLRDFLIQIDPSYPGIEKWLGTKVISQLASDSRTAFIVYQNQYPIASGIAKQGEAAKLCNLRIGSDWNERRLGTLLISLLALSTAERAKSMYFTVPESVWVETRPFFEGFGFQVLGPAGKQYRLWDNELACAAPMSVILDAVREKLPPVLASYSVNGMDLDSSLLLSIKPRFANAILEGRKTVEIRRQFSQRWCGTKLLIYASAPEASVVGECVVDQIEVGPPKEIWARYRDWMCCTHGEFVEYCGERPLVSALTLRDVRPLPSPVKRSHMEDVLGATLHAPQSYTRITPGSNWLAAVALGSLLDD